MKVAVAIWHTLIFSFFFNHFLGAEYGETEGHESAEAEENVSALQNHCDILIFDLQQLYLN